MDIFDLSAKITLDSSGFEQGVNSASSSMDGLSAKAVALGTALYDIGKKAASAFGELSKAALEGYANFEQLSGGIDTMFGSASDAVMKNAEQAFKTAGMSANEYMETAIGFSAALINSVGGDTERAAGLADRAITDMSDNANKMGTTLESLQYAYRGFSRGNFTMLDNLALGFSGTKEGMQELLDKAEELSGVEFDISSYADIVEAIHVVQTEMGITGTTAAEAAGTISGSVQTMKSAWDNWLAGLGNANADMSGLTDNLIDSFKTMYENTSKASRQIRENLLKVVTDVTGIDFSPLAQKFREIGGALIGSLGDAFSTIKDYDFSSAFEGVGDKIGGLFGVDISDKFSKIPEMLSGAFANIKSTVSDLFQSIDFSSFSNIFDSLKNNFENITGIDISPFTTGIQTLMSALDGLKSGGASGALENIVSSFEKVTGLDLSGIKDSLGQFGEAIDQVANAFKEGGLGAAVDELMTQLDSLTGLDVSGFFSSLGETYDDLVSRFNEGGLKGVFEGLVSAFQEAGPKIAEFGSGILDSVGQLLSDIGEKVYNAMPENVQALIDSIGNLISSFVGYLQALWAKIEPVVQAIAAVLTVTLVEAAKTGWEGLKNAFNTIVETLTAIFDFMASMYDAAAEALRGNFEEAAEAIKAAFDSVLDFFGTVANGIMDAFSGVVSFFSNLGSRMAEGLKSGFSSAVEDIKGIASGIASGFKDFFGIKSPSRLFAKYGSFMAQGLEKGWDGEIDSVVDKMSRGVAVHGTVDFASSSLGKSSAAQINTMLAGMEERGGNYNINLVVDGRTLANVVFDPLNAVSKQKGVAIGA